MCKFCSDQIIIRIFPEREGKKSFAICSTEKKVFERQKVSIKSYINVWEIHRLEKPTKESLCGFHTNFHISEKISEG